MLISYSDSSRDRTRTKTLGRGVHRKRCGIVTNSVGWRLERRSGNGSKPKPPDQRNSSACLPYSATENGRRGVRRSDAAARAPSDGRTDADGTQRVWRDLNERKAGFSPSSRRPSALRSARSHSFASHSLQPLWLPVSPPLASDRWATRHPSGRERSWSVDRSVTVW